MSFVVIAYPGNERLARAVAGLAATELLPLEFRHFPDGEIYIRVLGSVRAKTVIVVCGLDRPGEKTVGLFLLASTLRELGAQKTILVTPYLPYLRQDMAFHEGESVSARHFTKLLASVFDSVVTVDPHLHRLHALSDVFSIPAYAVAAAPAISRWILANLNRPLLIGPDSESEQWVREIARDAGCPFVVLEKKRLGDHEVEVSLPDAVALRGHTPVVIDDIVSSGRTMIEAAKSVRSATKTSPVGIAVHAICAGEACAEIAAAGIRLVTCNTVTHPSNAIDVHPLIAEAVVHSIG